MTNENLSELLRKKRQLSGLTQADVANKLHVSRQAISNWETGRHLPDLILVNQLANIYGISVSELVDYDSKTKLSKRPVKYLYSLSTFSILVTSRLTIASNSRSLFLMDVLILLSTVLFCLNKFHNLKVQLLVQLILLIVFLGCTFKTSLLNSFGFQTSTFLASIVVLCQVVSTYHYQQRK